MEWYNGTSRRAARVVSYLMERISDLRHANDVSKTSPGIAKSIILSVIKKLESHGDNDYVPVLRDAASKVIDSPSGSRRMVEAVIQNMMMDKEMNEETDPWRKNP